MTLEEKFATLTKGFAFGCGIRKVMIEVFESIRAEFKTYEKKRPEGMPTVENAFRQRGLSYQTIYHAIRREKERRSEDAQFFAEIKALASTKNIHGLDVTDDDLPVNTTVITEEGRRAAVLKASDKNAPEGERSVEIVYDDDGTSTYVKRGSLITLAEKEEAKAAAKAAAKGDGKKNDEAAETKRIAAAAAKADAALKSADFYAAQYFALVALINSLPKEMTPADFAETVDDNLRVAVAAMNAEEAKRLKPLPPTFPSFNGAKGLNNVITFLSADAIGRPSPLKEIFGSLDKDKFRDKVGTFAQRICDQFYENHFVVSVGNRKSAVTKGAAPDPKPNHPPIANVGTATDPTPHGFYAKLTKDTEYGTPWHVFQIGASEKPQAFAKTRQDAELKAAQLERKLTEKAEAAEVI